MQLISFDFFVFFLLAMTVLLGMSGKLKRWCLLGCNLLFYSFAGLSGLLLFGLFGLFSYGLGLVLERNRKKWILCLGLAVCLGPLLFYKYFDFLFGDILGLGNPVSVKGWAVPMGISFFTFQGVGYVHDVYRGKCKAEGSFLNYFIFLSFFPCISSGPINRPELLLPQIREYDKKGFSYESAVKGMEYILLGLLLKSVVASALGKIAPLSQENGFVLLLASIGYTIQIFCDFCGYSYIAFGLSKVLGLEVVQNFDRPYSSASVGEFWRRWHISLSSWLRDHVYIPLGGSRCSTGRIVANTLITFLISGIWHGANMTFVVWGLLHGVLIVLERLFGRKEKKTSIVSRVLGQGYTLLAVNALWILFAAPSLSYALESIRSILCTTLPCLLSVRSLGSILSLIRQLGLSASEFIQALVGVFTFLLYCIFTKKHNEPVNIFASKRVVFRWIKYFVIAAVILIFGALGEEGSFIYANF